MEKVTLSFEMEFKDYKDLEAFLESKNTTITDIIKDTIDDCYIAEKLEKRLLSKDTLLGEEEVIQELKDMRKNDTTRLGWSEKFIYKTGLLLDKVEQITDNPPIIIVEKVEIKDGGGYLAYYETNKGIMGDNDTPGSRSVTNSIEDIAEELNVKNIIYKDSMGVFDFWNIEKGFISLSYNGTVSKDILTAIDILKQKELI